MRVITGSARGVRLRTPDGMQTRPTAERVKEAVFSMIQFEIEGRRVLDLFAGTGQMGIEALSRGAARATFVDARREAAALVRENVRRARVEALSEIVQADYLEFLSRSRGAFDLIFLDPPYAEVFLENALKRISEIDILSDGGIIICERPTDKAHPGRFSGLSCGKDCRYGKTLITRYRKEREEERP
ncbi:MAG: 16S rRNA (guanine(966)-N(2))-methyltransferase RsmD [Oscillospiraceae bacterium]|nr:16S rRNA (guanine(966)-N(2))-methyltransferase RsmD [Oscillospiraceae bacterium]